MTLYETFTDWMRRIGEGNRPGPEITMLRIGLFQGEHHFMYLSGSKVYDEHDQDWACTEDYTPDNERYQPMPEHYDEAHWKVILEVTEAIIRQYLASPHYPGSVLAQASILTMSFDDGDMHRIV